ncbi:MAG: T9SS type A sorting domain-containing protein, partial [Bacteroidota bacterium]
MPVYPEDEFELLRKYLRKNINYRTRQFSVRRRAAMRNTNPWIGALGQNGIRNFSPLVSPDSISYDTWQTVFLNSHLWYYGSGGGSQTSAVGLGNSFRYTQNSFQAIFTAWFGSYFGDYDFPDNYLRAVLGSGATLSAVWAGAPHWHFHSMGMGFPLAHATVATQNNDTIYTADFFPRGVHTNLLGDPTLKAYILPPPTNLRLEETPGAIELNWSAPAAQPNQYYIYRKVVGDSVFTCIDSTSSQITIYRDSCPTLNTTYQYLVRAAKLETTPSGSFQNLSAGATNSIQVTIDYQATASFLTERNGNTILLTSTSSNAEQISWLFPDGTTSSADQISYLLGTEEEQEIQLIASNSCSSDTIFRDITTAVNEQHVAPWIKVFPNPARTTLTLQLARFGVRIELLNLVGQCVLRQPTVAGVQQRLNVGHLPAGVYVLQVQFPERTLSQLVRIHQP